MVVLRRGAGADEMARRYQVARRTPFRRWTRRIAGVVATGGLVAVGVASAEMILPKDEPAAPVTPRIALPPAVPSVAPGGPKHLTKRERALRRAAAAQVRRLGYTPERLADYRPDHVLRVLIGANELGRRAFFFVGKRYAGTDAAKPSTQVRITRQLDRQVTLAYARYAPDDRACCPRGGEKRVRFRWHDHKLQARDRIPSAARRQASAAPALR
jgi:LppP/LprE lipoprotein